MTYGIVGNTDKDGLWEPVAELVGLLEREGRAFCLQAEVAEGLAARGLLPAEACQSRSVEHVGEAAGLIFSFGGDGTLLRTAHQADGTPILGVNIGRLGFLTIAETGELPTLVAEIEAGRSGVEERMTLDVRLDGAHFPDLPGWALNDVVVDKSGTTSMIQIEAHVGGLFLNTYWADGLIVATPTGSTAYSLSVGGPILSPRSEAVVVTPIAPHTLTARPIVLPSSAELTLRVATRGQPYAFAVDGVSVLVHEPDVAIRIRRSRRTVRLVTLPGRDHFATIRDKLKWGQSGVF